VELPIISRFLEKNLKELREFVNLNNLNIDVILVTPKVEESFFSLLIGKGYPFPNRVFRWCTDRLKIRPTLHFFNNLTKKYSSIIMLVGVRKDESQNRERSIESRNLNHRDLSIHSTIGNAWVFSPISNLTTDEVWQFLTTSKGLWNKDYSELVSIYKKGSGEAEDSECSLSFDTNSKSCGSSRFGCWTCSVVSEDRSMNGMIQTGENHLLPLQKYSTRL
jgi:DNA sulfur modification protein DndC